MKNLLVTGGAGFIGSNFVRYWLTNHPDDPAFTKETHFAPNIPTLHQKQHLITWCEPIPISMISL